ncbi:hypothetical protein EDC01DRAFT_432918 [Geopyxis carbonaria]|nr:hypothetical protein EDC01DRAFT_432918 [Geopyxis carbonaria]
MMKPHDIGIPINFHQLQTVFTNNHHRHCVTGCGCGVFVRRGRCRPNPARRHDAKAGPGLGQSNLQPDTPAPPQRITAHRTPPFCLRTIAGRGALAATRRELLKAPNSRWRRERERESNEQPCRQPKKQKARRRIPRRIRRRTRRTRRRRIRRRRSRRSRRTSLRTTPKTTTTTTTRRRRRRTRRRTRRRRRRTVPGRILHPPPLRLPLRRPPLAAAAAQAAATRTASMRATWKRTSRRRSSF